SVTWDVLGFHAGHHLDHARASPDARVAEAPPTLSALAYTMGQHVVLELAPQLLDRELVRAMQPQRGGRPLASSVRRTVNRTRPRRNRRRSDTRCHKDGTCPDDPLADYQGSGLTTCNKATGTMNKTVTEHCAGDCVDQHESVHVADRGECCRRV